MIKVKSFIDKLFLYFQFLSFYVLYYFLFFSCHYSLFSFIDLQEWSLKDLMMDPFVGWKKAANSFFIYKLELFLPYKGGKKELGDDVFKHA